MTRVGLLLVALLSVTAFAQGLPDAGFAYSGVILEQGAPSQAQSAMVGLNLWPPSGPGLCSMSATSVPVRDGRFTLPLSTDCASAIANNVDYQVELVINGTVLPRSPVRAVPLAARAAVAVEAQRPSGSWLSATPRAGWGGRSSCRRIGDTTVVLFNLFHAGISIPAATGIVVADLPQACRVGGGLGVVAPATVALGGGQPGIYAGSLILQPNASEVVVVCADGASASFCQSTSQKFVTGNAVFPSDL